jgi:hypothetical protein
MSARRNKRVLRGVSAVIFGAAMLVAPAMVADENVAAPVEELARRPAKISPKSLTALLAIATAAQDVNQARALTELAAGRVDTADFLEKLPEIYANGESPIKILVLHALAQAGDAAKNIAPKITTSALTAAAPELRFAALTTLTTLKIAPPDAEKLLQDPHFPVRLATITALAAAEKIDAYAAPLQKAFTAEAPLRRAIVENLNPLAAPEIFLAALRDENLAVKLSACQKIAALPPTAATSYKDDLTPLVQHQWTPLRAAALTAFAAAAPAAAYEQALLAATHAAPEVRYAAVLVIAQTAPSNATALAATPVKLLADEDYTVRRRAAMTLLELGAQKLLPRAAVEEIAVAAAAANGAAVREGLWLLAQLKSAAAFPAALTLADGADKYARRTLLHLIGESGYTDGGGAAVKIYADKKMDDLTRTHAAEALRKLKFSGATAALAAALGEKISIQGTDSWVIGGRLRLATAAALCAINSPDNYAVFRRTLFSAKPLEEFAVVKLASQWLIDNRRTEAAPLLKAALANPELNATEGAPVLARTYEALTGEASGYDFAPQRSVEYRDTFISFD